MSRTAVVLFNLGGPDGPHAVQPFLFNLFNDPRIIGAPRLVRWMIATLISRRRAPVAIEIYKKIGGGSPLLAQTRAQATALQQLLTATSDRSDEFRIFVSMRYWHPFARDVAADVRAWSPDHVVLLPLYPQFSTTTSESSIEDWKQAAADAGLNVPTSAVCCYPTDSGWVTAQAKLVDVSVQRVLDATSTPPRILFSAHGLPKRVVDRGDPYQWQVEQTAAAVTAQLRTASRDQVVCYQSRVGPLEWIGPSTEAEIERAGRDGVPLVVVPIAFVSEHSETLVELDIEYREKAKHAGVPWYERTPTVQTDPDFISNLAGLARWASERAGVTSSTGLRVCPRTCGRCAMAG
jgi:ferrochelatase